MAPNVKSMGVISRHLSLLDLSSMTRSHSYQALSRAVSDLDLQQIAEPEFIEQSNYNLNKNAQAPSISEDYWGWDDEEDQAESMDVFDVRSEPIVLSKPAPAVDNASYWEWPSDTPSESEATDVLSLSNIEANLIQASNELNGLKEETLAPVSAHDDYWAEAVTSDAPVAVAQKPQHQQLSYWEWPTTTNEQDKEALVDAFKQEEAACLLVSCDAIERSLRSSAPATQRICSPPSKLSDSYWAWESTTVVEPSHVSDVSHPDYDYWTWKPEQALPSPVGAILAYERARVILSSEHIVEQLKKQTISEAPVVHSNIDSSDYWDTSDCQALGDSYWDERPAARAVSATGGYWDW